MTLTTEQQQVASRLDAEVQRLGSDGHADLTILSEMVDHMPNFKRLLEPQTGHICELSEKFHLDQLSGVRAEAGKLKDQIGELERYGLLSSGAIYTFFFAHLAPPNRLYGLHYMLWIPPLMVTLFGLRCLALRRRIKNCDSYIREAEDEFKLGKLRGARHWYDDHEQKPLVTLAIAVTWLLLFIVTLLLATFGQYFWPAKSP